MTLFAIETVKVKKKSKMSGRTPEGKVKREIKAIFDEFGIYWFCPATYGFGASGVPDFVGCVDGRFLAVEAKSKYTRHGVTRLQQHNIDKIQANNGVALVVNEDNLDELRNTIKELKDEKS